MNARFTPNKFFLALVVASTVLSACKLTRGNRDSRGRTNLDNSSRQPVDASMRKERGVDADGMAWKGLAFPTGDVSTSAVMLRKGVPAEVQLDEEFEYRLEVTNLTNHNLEDVVVSDRLPGKFAFKSSTPKVHSNKKGIAEWVFPKLAPNQSQVIRVRGAATGKGFLEGCSSVTYDSRVCSSIAVVQPALELTKSIPAERLICEKIPVRYVIKNTGSGTARNVRIKEDLSANLQTANRRPIAFTIPSLEAGKSLEFSVDLMASKTGEFHGRATATADGKLTANSKVTKTVVRRPDLKVTAAGPERAFLGRSVTYEFTLSNTGDAPAPKTILENTIPSGGRFVRASNGGRLSGGKVVWNLGTLAPSTKREVSVTVESKNAGMLRTDVVARAHCVNSTRAAAQTKMVGIPAILMEVIDIHDPIAVGEDETYEIRVTNQGTAPGTNIRIECVLEETMRFLSASGATRGTAQNGTVTFAPLTSLAPKAKASWKVVVKAVKPADARFRVNMTSDQSKRPVSETESSNFYK